MAELFRRPNILWIMTDEQRVDSLGCYGNPIAKTPTFDYIAKHGVRFENAICNSPLCVASRASMLTGKYPHNIGVMWFGKCPDNVDMFPEEMHKAGYQTANSGKEHHHREASPFWDYNWVFQWGPEGSPSKLGIDFKDKESEFNIIRRDSNNYLIIGGTNPLPPDKAGTAININNAIDFLKNYAREPFLLRVSITYPHTPVLPPKPFDTMYNPKDMVYPELTEKEYLLKPKYERTHCRKLRGMQNMKKEDILQARAHYFGLVSYVDSQLEKLLESVDKLNFKRPLLIICNSDHGINLGEHGLHGKFGFYDKMLRIPFIISYPGVLPENVVIDDPVSNIDIAPTLFDLLDIPIPHDYQGESLLPLINNGEGSGRSAAFSEQNDRNIYIRKAIRTRRWVMAQTPDWDGTGEEPDGSLYDLENDPDEKMNLFDNPDYKEIKEKLRNELSEWDKRTAKTS